MGLQKQLTESGNWLFRWRSFLPVTMVVCGVLSMVPLTPLRHSGHVPEILLAIGLGVSFTGLFVRVLTVGQTPAGTSGRNTRQQIAEVLNTTGIYSVVRHPLYLGNFLIGFGLACLTLNLWFVSVYILSFWLYYERIMLAEETFLRQKFGEQFGVWARITPAFLPRLSNYRASALGFSLRNVLRREYNAVLQIAAIGFLLKFTGDLIETGHVVISMWWCMMLGMATLIWTVLRSLKRHTRMLNVEGR